jgi:molecular chaperone HscB
MTSEAGLAADDFEIFALPRRYAIDRIAIAARRIALQAQVHPDRRAAGSAPARQLALQWSLRVNEAYRRLKEPLTRAAYLCSLHGHALEAAGNTIPAELLQRQMAWREALESARGEAQLEALAAEVASDRRAREDELARSIDERQDWRAAAGHVAALGFVARLGDAISERIETLAA